MIDSKIHIIILCLLLAGAGCKKNDDPVGEAPEIQFQHITPTQVRQFEETVTIYLTYQDSDGDLGEPHPDSLSLSIQDSRLEKADRYHIPPLAPEGHAIPVAGIITVDVNSPFLFGNGGEENIFYIIKVKDRAGNWSNTVETDKITIQP